MSKAACIVAKAPSYIGMPYKLGEEGRYVAGTEQTKAIDIDCSGLFWALLKDCGVLYKGKPLWRDTADGYWKLATKIPKPEKVGDCCWFPASGRKTHMAIYIGGGKTIEAGYHGPNNKYPGSGYVGTCTIAQMNARGAVWGRLAGLDIYNEEEDMNEAQTRALIQEELKAYTEWGGTQQEIKDAEAHLMKLKLISRGRAPAKALTWGLFALLLSRVLKLLGKP